MIPSPTSRSIIPYTETAVFQAQAAAEVLGNDISVFNPAAQLPRILVVDDSPTMRAAIVKALSGLECVESESTLDAFEKLKKGNFSLVIADVIIPGLSGVELLRKVVTDYPDISVIMVTGVDKPQRALDAVRQGAFDYLIKPVDPSVLQMTVDRALERQRLLLAAKQYKIDLEERNAELAARKTELESLQVQMVQNAKMASLGRLAAGVAHELNNPVGFIYSNLDLLQQDLETISKLLTFYENAELPAPVREQAEQIKSENGTAFAFEDCDALISDCKEGAERITAIVQNLRTFSRLDEAAIKRINIHDGIDSTIRLLSRYFGAGHVQLIRNYGEIPEIEAYAGQLNQVWMNILANAAQALPASGGSVTISTGLLEGRVVVEISDTGKGISQPDLERIFDPFYTTKPLGEGTGLGLSISFGIVQKHQGSIRVRSTVGVGTTFAITLPVDLSGHSSEVLR
jgi:two-component system, NtrC family, sensor kinase